MREDMCFDAVIVANGTFPSHPMPLAILKKAPHVVACDGAVRYVPDAEVVVGDGDSVPAEYHERLIQINEQEDNDLTKATRYCMAQGWHRIAYLSATGKREDHTLGNISLLMRYFRDFGLRPIMLTDDGFFTPATGDHTFKSFAGQQVSIFNFGCSSIQSDGLRWNSYAYEQWWQGTLNEALSDQFTIYANSYYLIYQTYTE